MSNVKLYIVVVNGNISIANMYAPVVNIFDAMVNQTNNMLQGHMSLLTIFQNFIFLLILDLSLWKFEYFIILLDIQSTLFVIFPNKSPLLFSCNDMVTLVYALIKIKTRWVLYLIIV